MRGSHHKNVIYCSKRDFHIQLNIENNALWRRVFPGNHLQLR